MQEAVSEIRQLRRQNEIQAARLSGFDDAMQLLRTAPFFQGQGMSEDLAYKLEKRVAEIDHEEKRELQCDPDPAQKRNIEDALDRKLR